MNSVIKSNEMHFMVVPLLTVLAGAVLQWLLIDGQGIVFHIGFLLFAAAGILFLSIFGQRMQQQERMKRIFLYGYIATVVVVHFLSGASVIAFLMVGIFMFEIFIRRKYRRFAKA